MIACAGDLWQRIHGLIYERENENIGMLASSYPSSSAEVEKEEKVMRIMNNRRAWEQSGRGTMCSFRSPSVSRRLFPKFECQWSFEPRQIFMWQLASSIFDCLCLPNGGYSIWCCNHSNRGMSGRKNLISRTAVGQWETFTTKRRLMTSTWSL